MLLKYQIDTIEACTVLSKKFEAIAQPFWGQQKSGRAIIKACLTLAVTVDTAYDGTRTTGIQLVRAVCVGLDSALCKHISCTAIVAVHPGASVTSDDSFVGLGAMNIPAS